MMEWMIVVSFLLAYPLFMVFALIVGRIIFTPLDKVAIKQQQERQLIIRKARRIRRVERLAAA